ncbi:hypothetical protein ANOM_000455 [Aspergillus nomiae NRRL 13137]|uniref:Azaphilone pigments biosynthesis cluster protein L N-terminal domain-containing protein n=1 Tax=Aspergillus nomiae NRRL (strain ATCC 15546 / NRRL 13137 / CBS 260.88 / M93) TaxID=1509407 RepID=A0A0L1JHT7_ASPN3|nr:uncharacterized protein ANOM_000455 [Aspergillus nomiae NRRL 13137]KNG91334.1 hypothetical protein ANOM_000455 [Aspergillus nomiae NRRL 13137]
MVPPRDLCTEPSNLSGSALSASMSLLSAVRNIKSLPSSAVNLIKELQELTEVLLRLSEMIGTSGCIDLSRLDSLLSLCGLACEKFEQELENRLSYPNNGVMSPRDWAKLRCMGYSVNEFRELLSVYIVTVKITLTDACFRSQPFVTTETLKAHEDLIQSAKVDVEMYLETLNERLEKILDPTTPELQQLKEWQLSVEKCILICTQLADRIDEIKSKRKDDSGTHGLHDATHHPDSQWSANGSTISNYSTGDAVQLMFSTNQRAFNGSNRGLGWRTRQAGGHFSDATGQQISKDFASISTKLICNEESGPSHSSSTVNNNSPSDPIFLSNGMNRALLSRGILAKEKLFSDFSG